MKGNPMNFRRMKKQLNVLQTLMLDHVVEATADAVIARMDAREKSDSSSLGGSEKHLVKAIIAALDIIEGAMQTDTKSGRWRKKRSNVISEERRALCVIHRNLLAALVDLGIQRIDPTGQNVDYKVHDIIKVSPTEIPEQDGVIAVTILPGYQTAAKTIRSAMVAVWKYTPQSCLMAKEQGD